MNTNSVIPEISIKDLLYVLLRKISIMVLIGAILGVALSGYKISQNILTYDILDTTTRLNSLESDVQYQKRVTSINKARGYVEMISRVNTQIENQRQYIANSVYMQINAEHEYQAYAQISITIPNNSAVGIENVLISLYEREIKTGDFWNDYSNEISVDPEYLKEVTTYSSFVPDNRYINNDLNRIASLNISVIGPSQEFCDDLMDLIIDYVNIIYSELNESVSAHNISLAGIERVERIDEGLRTNQYNQIARIDNLQKQIISYNDSLDKIAKELGVDGRDTLIAYFDTHAEETVDGIPDNTSESYASLSTLIKPGVKFGAVGFILGVVLVAAYIMLNYIFGKTFATQTRFFSEFSLVRKIGVVKPTNKRSKYCQRIDVKTEDDSELSDANNIKFIKHYYDVLAEKYENVLITGVGNQNELNKIVNKLGIKGDFKPDMFNNPDVIKDLSKYDAVVLIEKRNSSLIKSVYNEISILTNSGVEILGAIII